MEGVECSSDIGVHKGLPEEMTLNLKPELPHRPLSWPGLSYHLLLSPPVATLVFLLFSNIPERSLAHGLLAGLSAWNALPQDIL